MAAASAGDTIEVFPQQGGYVRPALRVTTARLTFRGVGSSPILLDGTGYQYSGQGPTPRAIFQFEPSASDCLVENFELRGAHNDSHNGSGVRINGASRVKILRCSIHANDMGIMSNGASGDPTSASDQLIESCDIYSNGDPSEPGYNHNLYLGGTSVTIRNCNIYGSLTGHNLKSRAHYLVVAGCYIHDSANRELDLVEAWDTERPNSNAVLLSNVIAKDPNCAGNRGVIHFGRESGVRRGTIFLFGNTILTPFASAVVQLSSPDCGSEFVNTIIVNTAQNSPTFIGVSNGASLTSVGGRVNWFSKGYSIAGTNIDPATTFSSPNLSENLGIGPPNFGAKRLDPLWKPVSATYRDGLGNVIETRTGFGAFWKGRPSVGKP